MALARAAPGWGKGRQELQCRSCGAYTSVSTGTLTHTYPFCRSNQATGGPRRRTCCGAARFVIPFKIDPVACGRIAQEWLGSSWLTRPACIA